MRSDSLPLEKYSVEQWRKRGEFFTHRGHRLFYIAEGTGPTVILLHGFITSSWDWSLVWPLLTSNFRLVALDFLGFGYSDKPIDAPQSDYLTTGRADSVLAIAEHLGLDRPHLVASSFGVSVVQELLRRREHNELGRDIEFASICLTNGGLFPVVNRPKLGQRLLLSRLGPVVGRFIRPAILRKNLLSVCGQSRFSQQRLDEYWNLLRCNDGHLVLHRTIRYLGERTSIGEEWTRALCVSELPVRLIWGGHPNDTVSGRSTLEEYRDLVNAPDTVLLSRAGHYPHLEEPERFAELFYAFAKDKVSP